MSEITYSEDFANKILKSYFGSINVNWILKPFFYMIDSKYRTKLLLKDVILRDFKEENEQAKKIAKVFTDVPDVAIINFLKWVHQNVHYSFDSVNFGKVEYWATVNETLNLMQDDCDGINKLIYYLARLGGIPSYLLWNVIGTVNVAGRKEGHYWLIYLSPKTGIPYTIDATYRVDYSKIENRKNFIISNSEYTKIWYIFNERYTFKPI